MPALTEDLPRVAVLLATYNGAAWLPEQLSSIYEQQGVSVHIFVSDDFSTDGSRAFIEAEVARGRPITLLHPAQRRGSAGGNFFHLIRHAPVHEAEFWALADQDDVWFPEKLVQAVSAIQTKKLAGYSSNFLAWYPEREGKRSKFLINKAQPQVLHDHLFQGPGPGCTFVLNTSYFETLQNFININSSAVDAIFFHDWLIYSHARSVGFKWWIDPQPQMLYRQHHSNVAGVSRGWGAAIKRLKLMQTGWYSDQVLKIAELIKLDKKWPIIDFVYGSRLQRLRLILHVCKFRRSWRDRFAMIFFLLILRS